MSPQLNMFPDEAWREYIADYVDNPKWLENGDDISESIELSKRELLGLILYSYHIKGDGTAKVCWDSKDYEPNDGYVEPPNKPVVRCEHKIVPQFNKEEVTKVIGDTYTKYSKLGKSYGSGLTLIIHANRQSNGLARISKLSEGIGDNCVFDRVFLAGVNGFEENNVTRFIFSEQYPALDIKHLRIQRKKGTSIFNFPLSQYSLLTSGYSP
jgi:hypothetical protein